MKNLVILLVIALVFTNCKEEIKDEGYMISGSIKGIEHGWVKLVRPNYKDRDGKVQVIDSTEIKNGAFQFIGKVDFIDMVNLNINNDYRTLRGFILENTSIDLTLDISNADKYGQLTPILKGAHLQQLLDTQIENDQNIFKKKNMLL